MIAITLLLTLIYILSPNKEVNNIEKNIKEYESNKEKK